MTGGDAPTRDPDVSPADPTPAFKAPEHGPLPLTLTPGLRLVGLAPSEPATIVAADAATYQGATEVVYRTDSGETGTVMVPDEPTSSTRRAFRLLATPTDQLPFDADANEFLRASEALRIKYAALYDPMSAVSSSTVQSLPHQIRAVYEEMLPRIPLRFLLADDPGAGKTIMAGLYLKELILREACTSALIVVPGGLADQWQAELSEKFDLSFEIFDPATMIFAPANAPESDAPVATPTAAIPTCPAPTSRPFLIARMDQLARNAELLDQLRLAHWDVVVVDEAHRMSAHFETRDKTRKTRRFHLGETLSRTAENFLLMTATPHAGKPEDYDLFLTLLDSDRFEGVHRGGAHRSDTKGMMRRLVKEDLLTFAGTPLFPKRYAHTVAYDLSGPERTLYEDVTAYVSEQMGRADWIAQHGNKRRGNSVGFALTILQRRLASSPEAILRSLQRRRDRLSCRIDEGDAHPWSSTPGSDAGFCSSWAMDQGGPAFSIDDFDDLDEETSEEDREAFEEQVDQVVDQATAARTVEELKKEVATLDLLVQEATEVRRAADVSDADHKWAELRELLTSNVLGGSVDGTRHKMIVFTEHRDTLDYLAIRIGQLLGQAEAVEVIHGGMPRAQRLSAQERFTNQDNVQVLVATDAAGEGLNLQRAHLMVNYDLPWNPNRIEQRFGRIHRIGQTEECQLWNLVATDTREGDVWLRLLEKIDIQKRAYDGNLFNVLGGKTAFNGASLTDLMVQAIRQNNAPESRRFLDTVIDQGYAQGVQEVADERALTNLHFTVNDVEEVRGRMEEARKRRLQPGYVQGFFLSAFQKLGGAVRDREPGRFRVPFVPQVVRDEARRHTRGVAIPDRYERICFDPDLEKVRGLPDAALIAAGHPLLQAVTELTIARDAAQLRRGAVLVDRTSRQREHPVLMYTVEQQILTHDDDPKVISHHFDYVSVAPDGTIAVEDPSVLLNFEPLHPDEVTGATAMRAERWIRQDHSAAVRGWAYTNGLLPREREITDRMSVDVERTRIQVTERLQAEMRYWDQEGWKREEDLEAGKKVRESPKAAYDKEAELERRLAARLEQLDHALDFEDRPPTIRSVALVIPEHLLMGPAEATVYARDTVPSEVQAVRDVLAAERALGRHPVEMAHNNPGFDIASTDDQGQTWYIEVKGRRPGASDVHVTVNEVEFAQTHTAHHLLALVSVDLDDPGNDRVRYARQAFQGVQMAGIQQAGDFNWTKLWDRGTDPQ
jgi:SNF2 family DNA or RNA helicase